MSASRLGHAPLCSTKRSDSCLAARA
jgi:hypothetical protein